MINGAQVDAAVSAVEDDLPPVAALVNNAGITAPTRFLDIDEDEWDSIFDVNVRGTFLVTRRVLPGLIDRGYGRIVNLSSVSAVRGGGVFGGSHYSAAKAAVLGLTRALAREVGPSGVTCNALAPGLSTRYHRWGSSRRSARRRLWPTFRSGAGGPSARSPR